MTEPDDVVEAECSVCRELCDVLGGVPAGHVVICEDCERGLGE